MVKVSKYEQRAALKRQAKSAGVAFVEPVKPKKVVFSREEAQQKESQIVNAQPGMYQQQENGELKNLSGRVAFMSREFASVHSYMSGDIIISITDTHAQPPTFFRKPDDVPVLHRGFHDYVSIRSETQGDRWCRIEDGEAIVKFIKEHKPTGDIIVHCNMGQSRSKAAAIAIAEYTGRTLYWVDRNGKILKWVDDGDSGNHRVYSAVAGAFLDYEEESA